MAGPALRAPFDLLRNAPSAATVTARHLLRGSDHVTRVPQPWAASPAYASALSALDAGDLTRARNIARGAGTAGRLLAHVLDGELAALGTPVGGAGSFRRASSAGPERVLHLVTNALPETSAGYTVRTQGIAEAQQRAGHEVHVVSRLGFPVLKGHLSAAPEVAVRGVPYHRLLPGRLPLRADRALAADVARSAGLVSELQPTVLHAHSNHVNGRVGLALRQQFGLPLVYEVRGLLEETWLSRSSDPTARESDFYRLSRDAETAVMRAADAVVTLSESLRDEVVARGVPAGRVHVVPSGVDDVWLDAGERPAPEPGLTVGIGGTLNDYEGVHVLVDAVALLRAQGYDARLLVVGDGPARPALEKQVADRGVADVATFTGRVPREDVLAAYRRLDVFCVPRLDLPVTRLVPPLKPIEAMALGVPVVVSDLPPLREVVGTDRGLLAAPGDATALAAAIRRLSRPEVRAQLGGAARSWVATTRTWRAAATTYEHVYASTRGETP